MIQCTARTQHDGVQCALERGYTGPHSVSETIDVPDGMAPFIDEWWERVQGYERTIRRQAMFQRLATSALLLAVGLNLGSLLMRWFGG